MAIRIHPHARDRMKERGSLDTEVVAAVAQGEQFPVQFGRTGFRRNFPFPHEWRGQRYRMKQVEAYAIQEDMDWHVITVVTRYF
ncbi:MAG: DUF4258 domain-containing protein [Candidatus Latescibacteria bacterium]|jgi:hypothetical protein|nr:DUF4258 domain-containing protein [Candidatus Latescibacterota bacterium]